MVVNYRQFICRFWSDRASSAATQVQSALWNSLCEMENLCFFSSRFVDNSIYMPVGRRVSQLSVGKLLKSERKKKELTKIKSSS